MGLLLKCIVITTILYVSLTHAFRLNRTTNFQPYLQSSISAWIEDPTQAIRVHSKRDIKPDDADCLKYAKKKGPKYESKNNEPENIEMRMNKAIDFFIAGESQIVYGKKDEVIVVLGISGSGKSTLLQFLTADNSKLSAVKKCGEMIIVDGNKKIGSSTKSHTKVPELIIDSYGNNYYDCPGFKDTNDAIHDIAAGHFIKKIFDKAHKIKLLFLIAHSRVRFGNDRMGFLNLAEHIIDLLPNIDKFKDSIALIVTKVDKLFSHIDEETEEIVFKTDSDTIKGVVEFLENVKIDSEESIKLKGKEKIDKIIKVIDILISTNDDDEYDKIGLFKRPSKIGRLSEDTKLQGTKKLLSNMIHNSLKFTTKSTEDIQYSIADSSKLYINKFKGLILNSAQNKLNIVKNKFFNSFLEKCKNFTEIKNRKHFAEQSINKFTHFINTTDFENFLKFETVIQLRNVIKSIDTHVPIDEDIIYMLNLIKFYNLIKTFVDDDGVSASSFIFSTEITTISQFLENIKSWFIFNEEFYSHLSQYEIQNTKQLYNVKNVTNWGLPNEQQGIEITKENIEQFLTKLPQKFNYIIQSYQFLLKSNISIDILIRDLNDAMSETLRAEMVIKTENSEMIFSGTYLKLSDISRHIHNNNHIQYFNIFASNTIFLDSDSTLYNGKHLSIISPKWVVINPTKIELIGKPGENHASSKAYSGSSYGQSGSDGLHGNSGYPSGNFLGMGKQIENSEFLHISTQGGQASSGQNGGNGAAGRHGNPHGNKYRLDDSCECLYCRCTSLSWGSLSCTKSHCKLYGESVGSQGTGANGGNGGKGGIGGIAGQILLHFHKHNVKTTITNGPNGSQGVGGTGGNAGYNVISHYDKKDEGDIFGAKWCYYHDYDENNYYSSGTNGKNGNDLHYVQNINNPELLKTADIVNKYKLFIYSMQSNVAIDFLLTTFDTESINNKYSLLNFDIELKDLKNSDLKDLILQQFYVSLLHRMLQSYNLNTNDNKIFAIFLVSSILSDLYKTTTNSYSLIYDIKKLSDYTKENLNQLTKKEFFNLKNAIVSKFELEVSSKLLQLTNKKANMFQGVKRYNDDNMIDILNQLKIKNENMQHKKREFFTLENELQNLLISTKVLECIKILNDIISSFSHIFNAYEAANIIEISNLRPDIESPIHKNTLHNTLVDTNNFLDSVINTLHVKNTSALSIVQSNYNISNNLISKLSNTLNKVDKYFFDVTESEVLLYENIKSLLLIVKNDIAFIESKLSTRSWSVLINIKQWDIPKHLNSVQDLLIKLPSVIYSHPKILTLKDDIENSISFLLNTHHKCELFYKEINAFKFISTLPADYVPNTSAITDLSNTFYVNMISGIFNQFYNTIILHVFPFAESYINFKILNPDFYSTQTTIDKKTEIATKQIDKLFSELENTNDNHDLYIDKNIFTGDFDSNFKTSHPFYIWDNTNNNEAISLFLSGELVSFKSDIFESKIKNALIFQTIALNLHIDSEIKLNLFLKELQYYSIRMIHSGNSLYKCDSKYFIIKSDSYTFEYSFQKDPTSNKPIHQNRIFQKFSNGYLHLSPYTTWRFQLIDDNSIGFDKLQKYKDYVQLELVGKGQYIKQNNNICNTDLEKYYTSYNETKQNNELAIQKFMQFDDLY